MLGSNPWSLSRGATSLGGVCCERYRCCIDVVSVCVFEDLEVRHLTLQGTWMIQVIAGTYPPKGKPVSYLNHRKLQRLCSRKTVEGGIVARVVRAYVAGSSLHAL